ncbi:hypothetical protein OFN32_28095, partial [Escherichia coli]|nr:hypothetical protein [Escherichia coli]
IRTKFTDIPVRREAMLDGKALGSETNPVCVQTLGKNKRRKGKSNSTWLVEICTVARLYIST